MPRQGGAEILKTGSGVFWAYERDGGPDRDRTDDLHNAIVALSQLSYEPVCFHKRGRRGT